MAPIWFSISCLWREVAVRCLMEMFGIARGGSGQSALQVGFEGDGPVCGRKLEGGGMLANKEEFERV